MFFDFFLKWILNQLAIERSFTPATGAKPELADGMPRTIFTEILAPVYVCLSADLKKLSMPPRSSLPDSSGKQRRPWYSVR